MPRHAISGVKARFSALGTGGCGLDFDIRQNSAKLVLALEKQGSPEEGMRTWLSW